MRVFKFFTLILILLLIFSCRSSKFSYDGIYIDGIYKNSDIKYKIKPLPKQWERLEVKALNLVFYNKKNNAVIYVNGKCKKSSDVPLSIIRTHLLIGFKNKKITKSEKISIENREGLHSIVLATLDGVTRKVDYYIFKKNGCLYDFVLISTIKDFDDNQKTFTKMLKSFKIIEGSNIKVFVND